VELAVGVDVIDPDTRAAQRAFEIRIAQELPLLEPRATIDQRSKGLEFRRFARASVILCPLHPALVRTAQQIEITVAVPVDDERVAVIVDFQGLSIGLDLYGFRRKL